MQLTLHVAVNLLQITHALYKDNHSTNYAAMLKNCVAFESSMSYVIYHGNHNNNFVHIALFKTYSYKMFHI